MIQLGQFVQWMSHAVNSGAVFIVILVTIAAFVIAADIKYGSPDDEE